MTKRPSSDDDMGETIKKVCLDKDLSLDDSESLLEEKQADPLVKLLHIQDTTDHEQYFTFSIFTREKFKLMLRIKKDWFTNLSGLARSLKDCEHIKDVDEIGVLPRPPGCNDTCLLVLLGLLAASSGDPSFLPRLVHGYVEFQSAHKFDVPTSVNTYDHRTFFNFVPVAHYFHFDHEAMFQCYVNSLPRLVGGDTLIASLLYCLPISIAFPSDMSVVDPRIITDYLCLYPNLCPDFKTMWGRLPIPILCQLAKIFLKHRDQLKSFESVSSFSIQMTPVILQAISRVIDLGSEINCF